MKWRGALAGLLVMCGGALPVSFAAATPPAGTASDERAALAEHRRLLLNAFADEEAACRTRFAVTHCVDDVRRRRREALAPLREREWRIEEAQRRARAAQRRQAVAAKQAAAAASAAAVAAAAASMPMAMAAAPTAAPMAASGAASRSATVWRVRSAAAAASAAAAREAEAAARGREAEHRRSEADAVRARIERRQADRESSGRRSDPLPLPGATRSPGAASAASQPN